MKIEEIKTIVKLMSEHDLTEFKIEAEEYNLCIRRGGNAPAQIVTQVAPAAVPAVAAMPAPAAAAQTPAAPAAAEAAAPVETIDSPLVGTFYRASSPEAQPFVKVGDKVTPDTVVGIIEAMKVMNEITSDVDGEIVEINVSNEEMVEYNQVLFTVKEG